MFRSKFACSKAKANPLHPEGFLPGAAPTHGARRGRTKSQKCRLRSPTPYPLGHVRHLHIARGISPTGGGNGNGKEHERRDSNPQSQDHP